MMKKLIFICIALLGFMSCDKNDDLLEGSAGDAVLLSYGFFAEDNEVLSGDYAVESISNSLLIRIPEGVDRTKLIARFELGENCEMKVGEEIQQSGVSVNDFTYPIDLMVTNTQTNKTTIYSITVKKILQVKWMPFQDYKQENVDSPISSDFAMAVSPTENVPYLFFNKTIEAVKKAVVVKAAQSGVSTVGTLGFSEDQATMFAIAFEPAGTPYVMFADKSTGTTSATQGLPTVMKYNGGSWSVVGNKGYGDKMNTSYPNSIAVVGEKVVTAYANNDQVTLAKRELNTAIFSGGSWSANQQIPGRPAVSGTLNNAVITRMDAVGNDLYLGVAGNGAGYSCYKYNGAGWSTLVESYLCEGATSVYTYGAFALAVSPAGVPYMAITDNATGPHMIQVIKYSGTGTDWVKVGNPIPNSNAATGRYFDMAIDKNGKVYVIHRSAGTGNPINIVSEDINTPSGWSDPVVLSADEAVTSSQVFIDFAPNGDGFAGFVTRPNSLYNYKIYRFALEEDEK